VVTMNFDGKANVTAISPNAEFHGEDKVLIVDLRLELLAAPALLDVFGRGLSAVCFDQKGARLLPGLTSLHFEHKFENVELRLDDDLAYKGVTVDKFKAECEDGPIVRIACTARIHHSDHAAVSELHQLLREQVHVAMSPQQGDLDLGGGGNVQALR
jgi:hypothetical protein